MKKHFSLVFCILLFSGAAAFGGDVLRIYFVQRASNALSPDNMTDLSYWEKVARSSNFVQNVPGKAPMPETCFQALYNDSFLFIRINAAEPALNKVAFSAPVPKRDSGKVFSVCHVEFFLDPDAAGKDAAQIVSAVNGGIYDGIISGNTDWLYDGVATRTVRQNGKWSMFTAFPWKDRGVDNIFGMYPHSHPLIGFNACRGRAPEAGKSGGSQWSKTPGNSYPRPEMFGILVMASEKNSVPLLRKRLGNASSGIELQGAVENASEIYRIALCNALSTTETNGKMLPEPRRSEILKECASIRLKMKKETSSASFAELLSICGKLNTEITEKQRSLSSSILDEI